MDQLGHTDSKLTLRIYARAMRRDQSAGEALRALAEGVPAEEISAPGIPQRRKYAKNGSEMWSVSSSSS